MFYKKRLPFFILPILLTCLSYVSAQQPQIRLPRSSQKASVRQTVGVTDITITYSRPAVKGRTIFGEPLATAAKNQATLDTQERSKDQPVVAFGHVWRAGANEATLFTVTDDVMINGKRLAAGSYSLHAIPGKNEWTIAFNSAANQWGSFNYDPAKDTLRITAKPEWVNENQESLEYRIAAVTANSATVVLSWEKARVPFKVEIPDVEAVWRGKVKAAMDADPTNWKIPLQVADLYTVDDKWDDAINWADQSIKIKETFDNLSFKVKLLNWAGRKSDALALADKALVLGKAENANTSALEKLIADMKKN